MKKIILLLSALLLVSCDWLFTPCPTLGNGRVDMYNVWLSGKVVDFSNNLSVVKAKDDFQEYAENNYRMYGLNTIYDYKAVLNVAHSTDRRYNFTDIDVDSVLVYLQISYDGKPIIYDEYPQGMPIMLYKVSERYSSYRKLRSGDIMGKYIIMTNGYVEFADSCYNDYIILPVAHNTVGADFDIKKCSLALKYENGKGELKNFKEFFEK
jgi:hypothetical protein